MYLVDCNRMSTDYYSNSSSLPETCVCRMLWFLLLHEISCVSKRNCVLVTWYTVQVLYILYTLYFKLPHFGSFDKNHLTKSNSHTIIIPAVSDILLRQTVAKILVGDPHQQIYGFRGATNAMALVDATHIYYLTQVFF